MPPDKPLVWLHGEIQTPPFTAAARIDAGVLLRRLQQGEKLGLPPSRAMPTLGAGCHELRIPDQRIAWRILYRVDEDAIVILDVFAKKSAWNGQEPGGLSGQGEAHEARTGRLEDRIGQGVPGFVRRGGRLCGV